MLCFVIVKKRIDRRKVMSCYHVSKNSRSQNSFLAETAVALSKDGRKEWATNALFKKKEERLGKHELKLYFTFTQKWSSTKYMLIFCNKWKLLHEKRVQSRQYFWGGLFNMAGELFCCRCRCFCFCFILHVTAVVVNSRDILR